MEYVLQGILVFSMFYIWFLPFLIVGMIYLIIEHIKKEKSYKEEMWILGFLLFFLILPFYADMMLY